jgi:prephenate dehydrogenase
MCPEASDPEAFATLKDFATKLGLKVIEKSTEEHDREMAYAQGLTFFVARALMKSNIHDVELRTPSFKKLLDLAELESHHSDDLFRTIQLGNTFTRKVRASFARQVAELLEELTEDGD